MNMWGVVVRVGYEIVRESAVIMEILVVNFLRRFLLVRLRISGLKIDSLL